MKKFRAIAELALVGIATQLEALTKGQTKIMAGITDITTAQTAEKADLVTLTGLITQLLAAFASGALSPAQAQSLLDDVNSEDATIKTNIQSIQAALPAAPAAPQTPPAPPNTPPGA